MSVCMVCAYGVVWCVFAIMCLCVCVCENTAWFARCVPITCMSKVQYFHRALKLYENGEVIRSEMCLACLAWLYRLFVGPLILLTNTYGRLWRTHTKFRTSLSLSTTQANKLGRVRIAPLFILLNDDLELAYHFSH